MVHINVTASADAGGAIAALEALKAAIASIQGKTVRVRVDVEGDTAALAALAQVRKARDAAGGPVRVDTAGARASVDGLSASAGSMSRNMNRARRDTDQAGRGINRASQDAAAGVARLNRESGAASDGVGGLIRSAQGFRQFSPAEVNRMGAGLAKFSADADKASGAAGGVGRAMGAASGSFPSAVSMFNRFSGIVGSTAGVLGLATAGSGLLTAGVGAMGVASAGALGLVGAGLGAAAGGMTAFAVDSLKGTAKFSGAFESMGRTAQGFAAHVSEPLGESLVNMFGASASSMGAIAAPVRSMFETLGGIGERNVGNMAAAAGVAAAAGASIAESVAPAFDAFWGSAPRLMQAAAGAMGQMGDAVGSVAGKAFSEATPAFERLASAAGALGSNALRTGAAMIGPTLDGMTSLTHGANQMFSELRPAMQPAMSAFVDVGNAVMQGLGNSAPAISEFARTVSANSHGLQQALEGTAAGALAVGGAVVKMAAQGGPALQSLGEGAARGLSWADSFGGGVNDAIDNALGTGSSRGETGMPSMGSPASDPGWFQSLANFVTPPSLHGALGGGGGVPPGGVPPGGGGLSMVSSAGHKAGGLPGQFSGFTSWMRPDGKGGLEADLPAGSAEQIQQIQNRIDAGGLRPSEVNRLQQAQRNLVRGPGGMYDAKGPAGHMGMGQAVPPENAFGGLSMLGRSPRPGAGIPGPGADASKPRGPEGAGGGAGAAVAPPTPYSPPAPIDPASGLPLQLPGPGSSGGVSPSLQGLLSQVQAAAPQVQQAGATLGGALNTGLQSQPAVPPVAARQLPQQVQAQQPQMHSAGGGLSTALNSGLQSRPPSSGTAGAVAAARTTVRAVEGMAPGAAAAGSGLGAAIGGGTGVGLTKTITNTLTIIKRWITRIIDTGASALGAHSPSRVFIELGRSIPDGLGIGVARAAPGALTATQKMTTQAIESARAQMQAQATQVGGLLPQAIAGAATSAGSAMPAPARPQGQQPAQGQHPGLGGRKRDGYGGVDPLGGAPQSPENERHRGARRSAQIDQETDAVAARWAQPMAHLDRMGMSESSQARVLDRWMDRQARIDAREARRNDARDSAKYRARYGLGLNPAHPGNIKDDAEAFRNNAGPRDVRDAYDRAKVIGGAIPQGMEAGAKDKQSAPEKAIAGITSSLVNRTKKLLGIFSPSQVFADMGSDVTAGLGQGMGASIGAASAGIRGVADDSGLKLGNVWGRSVVTGADAVIQKDLFQAMSVPTIENPQAKAALVAQGLLGPAGAGASIWKTPAVSFGAAPAGPQQVVMNAHFRVELDGQPFREMTITQIDEAMDTFASAITMQ